MKFIIALFIGLSIAVAKDGSNGCGPGWFVARENTLLSSSVRATTNYILFPTSTIGMTIGTSGCSKHNVVMNDKKSLHYITHHYYEIMQQMAQGEGPALVALSQSFGCRENHLPGINLLLKGHFTEIFPDMKARPQRALKAVEKVLRRRKLLSHVCSFSS